MSQIEKSQNSIAGSGLTAAGLIFYVGVGLVAAAFGFLAALAIPGALPKVPRGDPVAAEREAAGATLVPGRFVKAAELETAPDLAFKGADGKPHRLSEWRGKVVLLNLWATWCAPCKVEMPSLDRLQAKLGGDAFTVLAISVDRTGIEKPAAFFSGNKIEHLAVYNDSESKATSALRVSGLPVSVILDSQGREIARLAGSADWDSPETTAKIEEFIKSGKG